jgi:hypothetical protein
MIAATSGPISVGPDGSYYLQIAWESSVSWMVMSQAPGTPNCTLERYDLRDDYRNNVYAARDGFCRREPVLGRPSRLSKHKYLPANAAVPGSCPGH